MELAEAVRARRSIRKFLPDRPVPHELIEEALTLAMRAPSNSNVQPWQLFFASGERRERLTKALTAEVRARRPQSLGLPVSFNHLRSELGALVYGSMGIARSDTEARWAAQLRNWEFFGAPLAGVVCMHRDLGLVDSVGVGMFLQTFLLALTERGVGSCVQVSVAMCADVLRAELDIPDELTVLCGLSIGYPDPDFPANHLNIPRNPIERNATFYDD
jgi:nitroreductase